MYPAFHDYYLISGSILFYYSMAHLAAVNEKYSTVSTFDSTISEILYMALSISVIKSLLALKCLYTHIAS